MFKPNTLSVFTIIAMLLSIIGFVTSVMLVLQAGGFALAIISWPLLLWASYLGYRLTSYKLREDEYKKVGIRIYLIIAAFIAFMTVGAVVGIILAAALLSTLWGLKKNYDEWDNTAPNEALNAATEHRIEL